MIMWTECPSPLGTLTLWAAPARQDAAEQWVLCGLNYQGHGPARDPARRRESLMLFDETRQQLAEYFAGERREFTIPWEVRGTPFREQVWRELAGVGYGETVSYGELARAIGRPRAARQVGQAVGANPLSIVLGCHRVLGADGSLTGYRGGLHRKSWLLQLEGAHYRES